MMNDKSNESGHCTSSLTDRIKRFLLESYIDSLDGKIDDVLKDDNPVDERTIDVVLTETYVDDDVVDRLFNRERIKNNTKLLKIVVILCLCTSVSIRHRNRIIRKCLNIIKKRHHSNSRQLATFLTDCIDHAIIFGNVNGLVMIDEVFPIQGILNSDNVSMAKCLNNLSVSQWISQNIAN